MKCLHLCRIAQHQFEFSSSRRYKTHLQNSEKYCDIDNELQNQFLDFYHKFQSSFDGYDNWHNVSCDSFTAYRDCVGDLSLNWKHRGQRIVFDFLVNGTKPPTDLDAYILYDKCVICIDYGLENADGEPFVRVKCADGSAYDACHVICTVSLGVLKAKHSTLFQPTLPMAKRMSIETMSIGASGNVFVEFDSCVWMTDDWQGFGLLWNSEDLAKAIVATNAKWLNGVFRILRVDFQPNVLCVRIAGTEATEQMELANDVEITQAINYLLRTVCSDWNGSNIVSVER